MSTTAPATGGAPPRNVWELTASAHRSMLLGALAAFVGSALKIVPYIGLVEIARGLLSGVPTARLWGWVIAAVGAMAAHGIAYTGSVGANHRTEARMRHELRRRLVDKLRRVPLGWFNDRSSGQINRAVISDTEQIHTLGEGYSLVRREFPTAIGPVDIMAKDAHGVSVAVELKRVGDIDGVEQLTRYLELLNRDPLLAPVQGVFAAQTIKPQARTLAEDRGIRCVSLDYDAMRGVDDSADRLF